MELKYHAAYFKEPDGWYIVELLDFPGVFSQGKTLNSARWMIRDALKLMAEAMVEDGESLPRPNPKAKARKATNADFRESIRLSTRFQTAGVK